MVDVNVDEECGGGGLEDEGFYYLRGYYGRVAGSRC